MKVITLARSVTILFIAREITRVKMKKNYCAYIVFYNISHISLICSLLLSGKQQFLLYVCLICLVNQCLLPQFKMLTRFEECLGVLDINFMCQTFVSDLWSMVCSIIKAICHGGELGMCRFK